MFQEVTMFDPKYKAAEFAHLLDVSTGKLRDWRNRGVRFGVLHDPSSSSQPVYCDYDLYHHMIAMKLTLRTRLSLGECFDIAGELTPAAAKHLGIDAFHPVAGTQIVRDDARFVIISFDGDATTCEENLSDFLNQSRMRGIFSHGCLVFDIEAYAADLKHFIDEVLPPRREMAA